MAEHICPHCKNPTYDDEALLCHFCGESLGRYSSGGIGAMRAMPWKWIFVMAAGMIILTFLLITR